jgi:hypothetical protein
MNEQQLIETDWEEYIPVCPVLQGLRRWEVGEKRWTALGVAGVQLLHRYESGGRAM